MTSVVAIDGRPLSRPNTGIARYLHHFVRALVANGLRVTIVSDGALQTTDTVLNDCKLEILPRRGRSWWEQVTLRRHLDKNDYAVYIAAWNTGLPLLYRGSTRFAAIVYDVIPLRLPEVYLRRLRDRAAYRIALWATLRRAAGIVTISQSSRRDLEQQGYPGPIVVSAVPVRLRPPGPAATPVDPYFLYLGGLDPRKRIDVLVEAFDRFAAHPGREAFRLVLVGHGLGRVPYVVRSPQASRIDLPGYVAESAKWSLIAGASAVVFPSLYEGYGLPVAEAIALDVPVITGTGGALPEVGGDAALYVDPTDAAALERALGSVLLAEVRERLARARAVQRRINANESFDDDIGALVRSLLGGRVTEPRP